MRYIKNINRINYQIENIIENSKRRTALNIQSINNRIDTLIINKKNETNIIVENISNRILINLCWAHTFQIMILVSHEQLTSVLELRKTPPVCKE